MTDPRWAAIEELRWYYGQRFLGDMGLRAIDPSRMQVRGDPSTRGITPEQQRASERFRAVRRRVEVLTDESRRVLSLAFDAEPPRALESYGPYPRAVLHCGLAQQFHTESHTSKALLEWLRDRSTACRRSKGLDKARAERVVERIREATIAMVEAAIAEYAGTTAAPATELVTVTEIAQATGRDRKTVAKELDARGIVRNRASTRAPSRILVRMLWREWPEAAAGVVERLGRRT